MVTSADVRSLLANRAVFPELPADYADDTEIVLDSVGLIWFLHQVESRLGLRVDPDDSDLVEFTSVSRIVSYLNQAAPGG